MGGGVPLKFNIFFGIRKISDILVNYWVCKPVKPNDTNDSPQSTHNICTHHIKFLLQSDMSAKKEPSVFVLEMEKIAIAK